MSQLGRFDNTFLTPLGLPAVGASVAIYREGATVNGAQSGTTPLTITCRHRGKIAAGDTVFINTTTGTTYSVDSVTATTVVVSGFVGTLAVSGGDRITPSNSQPTLYSDDQGGATTSNPLTTSSTGRANCWMEFGAYDLVVSGGGATTTAFTAQVTPSETPAQIRFAEGFPGANAGEKIANAIADLPSTGGTVDARGLTGAQTIASTCAFGTIPVTLLLGAASYTLDAGITCAATANISVIGLGGTKTTLTRGAAYSGVLFTFSAAMTGLDISGLNIDNNNTAFNCINIVSGCADIHVHGNRFPNQGSGEAVEVASSGGNLNKRIRVESNYIESSASTQNIRALDIGGFGDDCRILGNTIIKTGAIACNQSSGGPPTESRIEVSGNHFAGVDSSNILVRPVAAGTQSVTDVIVTDNVFHDAGLTLGKGFIVVGENASGAGPPVFRRCVVSRNVGRGFGAGGSGAAIDVAGSASGTDASEIVVSNNIIDGRDVDGTTGEGSYGIYIRNDSRNVNVHDNIIRNTARSGITIQDVDFIDVHDNIVELAVQDSTLLSPPVSEMGGIQVQTGVTQAKIHNNKILNPGTGAGNSYGIYIRNNSTNDTILCDNNECIDNRGGSAAMTQGMSIGATALNVYVSRQRSTGGLSVDFTQAITAVGNTIRCQADIWRITSDGNYTMTSAPTIPSGFDGQIVRLINIDTSETVTIQDQGTLASSNLRLSAATIALAPRDNITLMYDATIADWVQIGQVNVT